MSEPVRNPSSTPCGQIHPVLHSEMTVMAALTGASGLAATALVDRRPDNVRSLGRRTERRLDHTSMTRAICTDKPRRAYGQSRLLPRGAARCRICGSCPILDRDECHPRSAAFNEQVRVCPTTPSPFTITQIRITVMSSQMRQVSNHHLQT